MKILFSVPRYHTNHDGMTAGLLAAGHEVTFLVRTVRPMDRPRPGVELARLARLTAKGTPPERVRGLLPALRHGYAFLRRERPDLVIARNPDSTSFALFLVSRLLGIRFLLYVQSRTGYEKMSPGRRLRLALGLWPRHTINTSGSRPENEIAGKTFDFIPFAVELLEPAKVDYPVGPPIRVLSVAKLDHARKNLGPLVRALAPLLRDGAARLTLAGLIPDQPAPAYDELLEVIATHGVGAAVTILQNLDPERARRLYAEHDVFVLASSRELAAISPAEAMAAGLPVIVGADNGTNYVVTPGETGVIFPDGDFAAMAAAVARLIDDPAEIARMGRNARRAITDVYAPAAFARRLEDLVERRFGSAGGRS